MPPRNNWSREELILAYNLYCKVTFTKINASNKDVKNFSTLIGRSNNAVALKLANFARLDPELQNKGISGMGHGSKGEEQIWKEFNDNWQGLAFESEILLANYKNITIEQLVKSDEEILSKKGIEREAIVKVRVNQSFFRDTVLASYNNCCCMTGISIPDLLVASHIIPWSHDPDIRVNPHNGLCLNGLHDKAFDKGLITITPSLVIQVSPILLKKKDKALACITDLHGKQIQKPQRFVPLEKFLNYHNNNIFKDKV